MLAQDHAARQIPPPSKNEARLLVIVLVVVLVLENRFLPRVFLPPSEFLHYLKDRRIESSVKNTRYGKTLFEDEDDDEYD